jgi:uncharacterized protein YdaT
MNKKRVSKRFLIALIGMFFTLFPSTIVMADSLDLVPIFDDYNRLDLGVEGEGGGYNSPNSAGIPIYWIQMRNVTAKIEDNALKLDMDKEAWFGEGVALKNPAFKYIIMKIKGEKGGEEKLLTLNPDAKGLKKFTQLKGPDGEPLPKITKEYQNLVIDIAKSGFTLPGGFEAIHFNNTGPLTVYIDEIYLSKDGVPIDLSKALEDFKAKMSALADENNAAENTDAVDENASNSSIEETSPSTEEASASVASIASGADSTNVDSSVASKDSGTDSTLNRKTVKIAIIIAIMVILITAVIYNSFIRKPASER